MQKENGIIDIIKGRRSIRAFTADPVPRSVIEMVLVAAQWAPSGGNKQNWRFIVAETPEIKEKMHQVVVSRVNAIVQRIASPRAQKEYSSYSSYYMFFAQAPAVIAVVKKPYDSLARRIMERSGLAGDYHGSADVQGPAAAIQNMLLAAHALGYGTCWMTGPLVAKEELEEILSITAPDELIALVPLGAPAKVSAPPERTPLADIVEYR